MPDDKRRLLVEAAARVLAEDGLAAVSVRRLADEVGASTMAVYTWFGGKDGLLAAVRAEAFDRFGARLRAVRRTDEPVRDLLALAHAYRRFAKAEPALYAVMFGRALAHVGTAEQDAAATGTFDILVAAVERTGTKDAEEAARELWAAVHGHVSLELADVFPRRVPAKAFDRLLLTMGAALAR